MSDPLEGLNIRSRYMTGGREVTRQMIRDVAEIIRDANGQGIRASEIGIRLTLYPFLWKATFGSPRVDGTDRRLACALQLLRKRGAIRQSTYPRWVWKRGAA